VRWQAPAGALTCMQVAGDLFAEVGYDGEATSRYEFDTNFDFKDFS